MDIQMWLTLNVKEVIEVLSRYNDMTVVSIDEYGEGILYDIFIVKISSITNNILN